MELILSIYGKSIAITALASTLKSLPFGNFLARTKGVPLHADKPTQFNARLPVILQSALPVISFYLRLSTVTVALTAIALQFHAERGLRDIYSLTYLFSALFMLQHNYLPPGERKIWWLTHRKYHCNSYWNF
ncbi:MAG: hypothetical protein HDR88_00805 [Bacteroides sp.]|nr:hypothetical protein [Bacteroides sp.]